MLAGGPVIKTERVPTDEAIRVGGERSGEDLQGDLVPHAALADEGGLVVVPEAGTDFEAHGSWGLGRVYCAQPELDDENGVFWDEARNPFLTISQVWAGSELPIASHPHADQRAFDRGNHLSLAQRHHPIDHLATAVDPNLVV